MINSEPLVAIRCIAYNQEAYIKETLDGFVSQRTTFPFVAIVHDDASTDNTSTIIREYAEKFPKIIIPIFETENQHSKPGNSLGKIMSDAIEATGAKYIAYCEGDDYWCDSYKLQKQVDFLEAHPEYSLCFHAAYFRRDLTDTFTSYLPYKKDCDVSFKQIVLGGGMFCPTPSLMVKSKDCLEMPDVFRNQHVGDYPLQIYIASKGKVRYMASPMCVYRVASQNSWTQRMKKTKIETIISKEEKLLTEIDHYFSLNYHSIFQRRELLYKYQMYYGIGDYINAFSYAKQMISKGMNVPLRQLARMLLYKFRHSIH